MSHAIKTIEAKADASAPLHTDDVRAVRSLVLMERARLEGDGDGYDFTNVISSLDQIIGYRALVGGIAVGFREYKRLLIVEAMRIDARMETDEASETAEARAMGVDLALISSLKPRADFELDSDIPY